MTERAKHELNSLGVDISDILVANVAPSTFTKQLKWLIETEEFQSRIHIEVIVPDLIERVVSACVGIKQDINVIR